MEKQFYTVEEVAELLGFTTRTIRKFITDGLLEAVKFRTEYRVTQTAIDEYVKENSTRRDHKIDATEGASNHNE